jgi:glycosyltransferase involved in cell wall biosynthesis
MGRKIVIVTDAWTPQVNGVVVTLTNTKRQLEELGHAVYVINAEFFSSFPLWVYPDVQVVEPIQTSLLFDKQMQSIQPDCIHIATEGTLGLVARNWCRKNKFAYTTAYHTKFPQYIKTMLGLPEEITYTYLRWFHASSEKVLVTTPAMKDELASWGIHHTVIWSRGVNFDIFNPSKATSEGSPYILYAGRVSAEKNLEAFLNLDIPNYVKKVAGDGPQFEYYKKQYPDVEWLGSKTQFQLAELYASAECFVFPSLTDTFGLVMIEAIACGTPVAAYDTKINRSILSPDVSVLKDLLEEAVMGAIELKQTNKEKCVLWVQENYSWAAATNEFLSQLVIDKHKKS